MIYWIIGVLIIISIFWKRKNSKFYFKLGLYLFIAVVFLRVINLVDLTEFLMRVDFMLWAAGIFLAIKENKYET